MWADEFSGVTPPPDLSPSVWAQALTHPQGDLAARLVATSAFFKCAIEGTTDRNTHSWPGSPLRRRLNHVLSDVLPLAHGQPVMANAITESYLRAVSLYHQSSGASVWQRAWARQRAQAALLRRWQPVVDAWRTLSQALDGAAAALGLSPLVAVQLAQQRVWHTLEAVADAQVALGALRGLLASLGRGHEGVTVAAGAGLLQALSRATTSRPHHEVRTQATVHGLTRTDDPGRMLPSEAIGLLHPRLRLLWHARRASGALLAHHRAHLPSIEGTHTPQDQPEAHIAKDESGPVIICLDRSGSMHGEPADRARALIISALKLAHEERRRCMLYAFSGPRDLERHPLALTAEGFEGVLRCLQRPFTGTTDITPAIRAALEDVAATTHWAQADILLISDGRFTSPPDLRRRLEQMRASRQVRLCGVLVAERPAPRHRHAMETLCDSVWQVW
ncbi:MAG: vWA domain-containing protein [Bradymonadia bacterium]